MTVIFSNTLLIFYFERKIFEGRVREGQIQANDTILRVLMWRFGENKIENLNELIWVRFERKFHANRVNGMNPSSLGHFGKEPIRDRPAI